MLSAVLSAALSGPGHAETYTGAITCAILPGYTRRPLVSRLEIDVHGAALSYTHPALDWQGIPMPADHTETGSGSLQDGRIQLEGAAKGNKSWSYTARYDGTVSDGVMRLQGSQIWNGLGLPPATTRICNAELRRTAKDS